MAYCLLSGGLWAQSINEIVNQIEQNNTVIKALESLKAARQIENRTTLFPEEPEIESHYLWGDPALMGTRRDFSITQSFDFPTVYRLKKQQVKIANNSSELNFLQEKLELRFHARQLCYQLIYLNAYDQELRKREEHAQQLSKATDKAFEVGEANIIERNKAAFHLLNIRKDLEENELNRQATLAALRTLNGGLVINFNISNFEEVVLPPNFENWYREYATKITEIQLAKNRLLQAEQNVRLNKALQLPKFTGGYMSESTDNEAFRGIVFGLSIPLWNYKNKLRLAKAQKQVALEQARSIELTRYDELKALHAQALSLQKMLKDYRQTLTPVNSSELLKKAFDAGEISLPDYLTELSTYYEAADRILQLERDLHLTVAKLMYYAQN